MPSLPYPLRPHASRRGLLALAVLGALVAPAIAQDATYPTRPVRMVVSYASGNVTDVLARIVADKLSERWGQPVVVDNKPGQGGSVGAQIAVKAPNDGYTLLFSAMAAMAINPHVYPNVGYDVRKDFVPIINVAYSTGVFAITPSLKIHTLKQLVDYSKANPTVLSYGTAGNGTVPHLNIEAIKAATGLVAQHVPYKAAAAVMTDVLGGRIHMQADSITVLLPQIKAGKLVPLMASSYKRLPQLPELPTMTEVIPGLNPVTPWLGIFAPTGTPPAVLAKVQRDVAAILQQRDVQEKFDGVGLVISGDGPELFSRMIADDHERLGKLVKQLNLKVD